MSKLTIRRKSPTWQEAAAKTGELLVALAYLDDHPEPCAEVRADMNKTVDDLCADPVAAAMVGYLLLCQEDPRPPSKDGDAELQAFGRLVREIRNLLEYLANEDADEDNNPAAPSMH